MWDWLRNLGKKKAAPARDLSDYVPYEHIDQAWAELDSRAREATGTGSARVQKAKNDDATDFDRILLEEYAKTRELVIDLHGYVRPLYEKVAEFEGERLERIARRTELLQTNPVSLPHVQVHRPAPIPPPMTLEQAADKLEKAVRDLQGPEPPAGTGHIVPGQPQDAPLPEEPVGSLPNPSRYVMQRRGMARRTV